MEIWKYEQTDFATEWEVKVLGLRRPGTRTESTRDMWAVSVRGRVFTGFETKCDARAYGKRIETEGTHYIAPSVSDIASLPEALADAIRSGAREDGYVYDSKRLAWVKALGDALTSGFYDDEAYADPWEAARDGFEPEITTLLEMVMEHLPTILAAVRLAEEEPHRLAELRPHPITPRPPRLMASAAVPPTNSKIEPLVEHYPQEVRLDPDN